MRERKEVMHLSKREEYEARAEKLLEPIMEENHFELVDVEYVKEAGNWYLRAYVDKEGGITLDDCELVNRAWSDLMDENDFIPEAYILEVSSPGLGRQLKKEKDFKRSIGQDVDVKFYQSRKIPAGRNGKEVSVKEITGTLKAYTKEKITLETDFAKEYEIACSDISTVKHKMKEWTSQSTLTLINYFYIRIPLSKRKCKFFPKKNQFAFLLKENHTYNGSLFLKFRTLLQSENFLYCLLR